MVTSPEEQRTRAIQLDTLTKRLIALIENFFQVLGASQSDLRLYEVLVEVPDLPWGTKGDYSLLHELVECWLTAVNKEVFQKKIAKARPDQRVQLLTEDVASMRPLSSTERQEVLDDFADGDLMAPIRKRLLNLVEFHIKHFHAYYKSPAGESLATYLRRQEQEAKRKFPKLLKKDVGLLAALTAWYLGIMIQVLNPRLEELRKKGHVSSGDVDRVLSEIAVES